MSFMVQDLLDYAQIKANKFRKNLKSFNIRESVDKVMCIQRQKAQEQTIDFYAEFINIGEDESGSLGSYSPIIYSDE